MMGARKYLACGTDILSVKCPKCGAEPGLMCRSSGGSMNMVPHAARYDLAEVAKYQKQPST